MWLTTGDHVVKYAVGETRKSLERLVPNLTVSYDKCEIKPNLYYTKEHLDSSYEVYAGNKLYMSSQNLDSIVRHFKSWTEEDLENKKIHIREIQISEVTLLR